MHDHAAAASTNRLSAWLKEGWSHAATCCEVEIEGAIVRYRGWNLHERTKPGLVLVHGFLAHSHWWDHIAPRLIDRHRVIALDFTGMGDSGWRPIYSRRQYAREIIAVSRHAGFDRAILVAHSFGSGCALFAAVLAPDFVTRVIVIDGRVFQRPGSALPPDAIRPETFYRSFADARAHYRLLPPGEWEIPEVVDHIARHSIRRFASDRWGWKFDPEAFRMAMRDDVETDLDELAVPVDFIHAADSDVVNTQDIASFLAKVPTCGPPVTVPLSHHHIMIEQPVGLLAALGGLLAVLRGV